MVRVLKIINAAEQFLDNCNLLMTQMITIFHIAVFLLYLQSVIVLNIYLIKKGIPMIFQSLVHLE